MDIKTFVSKSMDENCYAVNIDGEICIIDPGEFSAELEVYVNNNIDKIKYILLTHCHFDHIMGVTQIKNLSPNIKVVIHTLETRGLLNPDINLGTFAGADNLSLSADETVTEGDIIKLGSKEITVMHTPGHTVGSVCYMVDNILFSGDTLFNKSYGRTDFPGGNVKDMVSSLKRLSNLDDNTTVYSGHGLATTIGYEKEHNAAMANLG